MIRKPLSSTNPTYRDQTEDKTLPYYIADFRSVPAFVPSEEPIQDSIPGSKSSDDELAAAAKLSTDEEHIRVAFLESGLMEIYNSHFLRNIPFFYSEEKLGVENRELD